MAEKEPKLSNQQFSDIQLVKGDDTIVMKFSAGRGCTPLLTQFFPPRPVSFFVFISCSFLNNKLVPTALPQGFGAHV